MPTERSSPQGRESWFPEQLEFWGSIQRFCVLNVPLFLTDKHFIHQALSTLRAETINTSLGVYNPLEVDAWGSSAMECGGVGAAFWSNMESEVCIFANFAFCTISHLVSFLQISLICLHWCKIIHLVSSQPWPCAYPALHLWKYNLISLHLFFSNSDSPRL